MNDIKKILIASICVVLAVAIAAGVSIGVLAGTVNGLKDTVAELQQANEAQEALNASMQAELDAAKANGENIVTAEEFEAKLAAAIGEQNQTMQALISTAVKNQIEELGTEGLTEAQVQEIIDAAVANCLTEADIDAIIADANTGLTSAEVKKIVADYTAGTLTYGQIVNLVEDEAYALRKFLEDRMDKIVNELEEELDVRLDGVEGEVDNLRTTATPSTIGDVINAARPGDTVTLAAGDYETLTLNAALEDVTIDFTNADVNQIVIPAGANLKDVVISGVEAETSSAIGGGYKEAIIKIEAGATVTNVTVEGAKFTAGEAKYDVAIHSAEPTATITVIDCEFDGLKYAFWTSAAGFDSLTFNGCDFVNMTGWAILNNTAMPGDMTVTNCTFKNCKDGLVKSLSGGSAYTFTFTNNTIVESAGHDNSDAKWFALPSVAGSTAVVSGNTKDGVAWTPDSTNGLVVE